MRNSMLIVGVLLLGGCLFSLDDPPSPEGVFQDRLNLERILTISKSTTAYFIYDSYRELFRDTVPFFVDFENQVFDRGAFLARLNQIDAAPILSGDWAPAGVNDGPVLEQSPPTELATRTFTITSGDGSGTRVYTGSVKIWVWFNDALNRWQIVQWREADGQKSIFHPEFDN